MLILERQMKKSTIRNKRKSKSFNPSRSDISEAMKDYQAKGGKIEKMETFPEEEMDRILSYFTWVP